MNPSIRDAILRLSKDTDFGAYAHHLMEVRKLAVESLAYLLPDDAVTIARMQGRVQAIDEVLALVQTAQDELDNENQQRTNNA